MVTSEERVALLAVRCNWCSATVGEDCYVPGTGHDRDRGTRRWAPRRITTLEGGFHDARWQTALSRPASVLTTAVPRREPDRPVDGQERLDSRVPELAGSRPW